MTLSQIAFVYDPKFTCTENLINFMHAYAKENSLPVYAEDEKIIEYFKSNHIKIFDLFVLQTMKTIEDNLMALLTQAAKSYKTRTTSPEIAVKDYFNEIRYDAHSLPTKVGRSAAGNELIRRGKSVLKAIGKEMKDNFSNPSVLTNALEKEMFTAWIYILAEIIIKHKLPSPAFDTNISYSKQGIEQWIDYCEEKG